MTWTFTDVDSLIREAPRDLEVAAAMYAALQQHYPGHQWATTVSHETGMAVVRLLYLDRLGFNARYGFQIKLEALKSDPTMKLVVRAGGEMLERYGLARGPATEETKALSVEHGLDVSR